MTEKFGYKNAMQIPKLDKIVLNMGVGEAVADSKKAAAAASRTWPRSPVRSRSPPRPASRSPAVQAARRHADRRKVTLRKASACTSSSTA
jgi:hypothetical protein